MSGYFKISRKITNSPAWLKQAFSAPTATIDLIQMANFKAAEIDVDGFIVKIERGQIFTTTVKLAERWKWSRGRVNRFLLSLIDKETITVETTNKYSIITLVKYSEYQKSGTALGTTLGTALGTTLGTGHGTTLGTGHGTTLGTAEKPDKVNKNKGLQTPKNGGGTALGTTLGTGHGTTLGTYKNKGNKSNTTLSLLTRARKAFRFPENAELPNEWIEWCKEHTPNIDPKATFEQFKDHWLSTSKNAAKLDWFATWRNWCRREWNQPKSNVTKFRKRPQPSEIDYRAGLEIGEDENVRF